MDRSYSRCKRKLPDEEEPVFHPEGKRAQAEHALIDQDEEEAAKPILDSTYRPA